jgi:hypothetical protein
MSIFEAEIVQTAEWKLTPKKGETHWILALCRCYGGFRLSKTCIQELKKKGKTGESYEIEKSIRRDDPDLISIFKTLGNEEASGDVYGFKMNVELIEFDLPSTQGFNIGEEDGYERVIIFDLQKHAAGEDPVIKII